MLSQWRDHFSRLAQSTISHTGAKVEHGEEEGLCCLRVPCRPRVRIALPTPFPLPYLGDIPGNVAKNNKSIDLCEAMLH